MFENCLANFSLTSVMVVFKITDNKIAWQINIVLERKTNLEIHFLHNHQSQYFRHSNETENLSHVHVKQHDFISFD